MGFKKVLFAAMLLFSITSLSASAEVSQGAATDSKSACGASASSDSKPFVCPDVPYRERKRGKVAPAPSAKTSDPSASKPFVCPDVPYRERQRGKPASPSEN